MNILILFELIFVCVRKVICHVAVSLFWQHDTTKGDEILTMLAVSYHAFFQFDLLDASRLSIVFKKLKSKIILKTSLPWNVKFMRLMMI